jgi:hypothetical protein
VRPPGPKPGALKTELHSVKVVSAAGVAPAITPSRTEHVAATPRAVCPGAIRKGAGGLFSLEANRSVPGRRLAVRFGETRNAEHGVRNSGRNRWLRNAGHSAFQVPRSTIKFGSGGGSCTHLTEFMRLRSVLWSSSPQVKFEVRSERSEGTSRTDAFALDPLPTHFSPLKMVESGG